MHTLRMLVFIALASLTLGSGQASAEGPNLGKPITAVDIAAWDIDVEPDGAGLPPGSGTSDQGAAIFADNCALCHGKGSLSRLLPADIVARHIGMRNQSWSSSPANASSSGGWLSGLGRRSFDGGRKT